MSEAAGRALLPLRFALRSLWFRRLQFALLFATLSTAFWSAFGIAGMVSGSLRQFRADLERLGWDLINVHPHPDPLKFLGHGLTAGEGDRLAELVSGISAPVNFQPAVARGLAGGASGAEEVVLLLGTTPAWNDVHRPEFLAGRFFRSDEGSACAVDQWAYRRLFPDRGPGELRGDETIELEIAGRRRSFNVVGVIADPVKVRERYEDWDTTGASRSNFVRLMEYKNVYLPRSCLAPDDAILAAVIRVGEGIDPEEGARRIQEDLVRKGSTALAWSRRRWARSFLESGMANLSIVSNFVWIVVLLVTSFMVVTVTFIIVRQRFPEIAIRRVEGASIRQIAWQVIFENLLLTLLAAGLGLLLARLSSGWIERNLLGWPVPISLKDVSLVGAGGILIMVLTTVFPARRAAAVDPVQVFQER